ncbi:LysR substrate-binding domain-containing protein [Actimicrobium sp. CCC2.4]|uniref:LysR family transcriptional regulator n=1 Tax=Actimicrobium sp. CCC2.4 TaxID=3048606 RepID=UPI002AC9F178|nr:LysR substrate-binding domain-containing protein [Actimicrobium sp. CCC2.4]MEB0134574.1 LysR substrate-binding domain-containing protein [Actimicrobium sp. CCC2.4]WPX34016.1 LysR substrate-binding domain-containing protein [Actimicrobium sp. CCC2.4]
MAVSQWCALMELRQLKYFVAIADCRSFSKAAEKVFVAQSALSHQIAQLEAELGIGLFHRSRRGVELTDAGARFFPYAVSILRQTEEAIASARSGGDEPSGKVVFGLPHSVSNALALPLLREVHRQFPKIQLELTEELTGNLIKQLRTGQIHLSVLFDDGQLSEFTSVPFMREQMYLIEPSQEVRKARSSITLKQALAMPLILPAHPHGLRPLIEGAAMKAGLASPPVFADISSISILRTTLLAGLGRTLLPLMPFKQEIDAGLLVATLISSPTLERTLALCGSGLIPASSASQAVGRLTLDLVRTLCTSESWPGAQLIE